MQNVKTFLLIKQRPMRNVLTLYLNRKMVMRDDMTLFLNIKRVIRNGIFGISVGAYCIRFLRIFPKETYDQKCRYMWGVFNTPPPLRTERSISKIDFLVMRNGMTFILIRQIPMQNVLTYYLNRKMIMLSGIFGFSVGSYCIRPLKTS